MKLHHTEGAPQAIGPYSQAVAIDGWLFTSGQIGLDPATGELVDGGFETEARQVLENLRQVLATAGCGFSDVIKSTVYVTDLADQGSPGRDRSGGQACRLASHRNPPLGPPARRLPAKPPAAWGDGISPGGRWDDGYAPPGETPSPLNGGLRSE
jgi:enamine deaminase RidA (YjgF/YER057c/UK114 family)